MIPFLVAEWRGTEKCWQVFCGAGSFGGAGGIGGMVSRAEYPSSGVWGDKKSFSVLCTVVRRIKYPLDGIQGGRKRRIGPSMDQVTPSPDLLSGDCWVSEGILNSSNHFP